MKRTHSTVAELIARLQTFPPDAIVGQGLKDSAGNRMKDKNGDDLLQQIHCEDGFCTVQGGKPVVAFWGLDARPGKFQHKPIAYREDYDGE